MTTVQERTRQFVADYAAQQGIPTAQAAREIAELLTDQGPPVRVTYGDVEGKLTPPSRSEVTP